MISPEDMPNGETMLRKKLRSETSRKQLRFTLGLVQGDHLTTTQV